MYTCWCGPLADCLVKFDPVVSIDVQVHEMDALLTVNITPGQVLQFQNFKAWSTAGLEIRKFFSRSTYKLLAGPREILTGPQIVNKTWKISKIFFSFIT